MGCAILAREGAGLLDETICSIILSTHLVGDSGGPAAHFKALGGQVPVGARPLACQLHAAALVLLHNLAQTKVLRRQEPIQAVRWRKHNAMAQCCDGTNPSAFDLTLAVIVCFMQWHTPLI